MIGRRRGQVFDPEALARARTHDRLETRDAGCPRAPVDPKGRKRARAEIDAAECTCPPDLELLGELWEGRARMASARRAAGSPLDDFDRAALAWATSTATTTSRSDAA